MSMIRAFAACAACGFALAAAWPSASPVSAQAGAEMPVFDLDRGWPKLPNGWVLGMVLGGCFGLMISFFALAVANAVGPGLNTSAFAFLLNVIPFSLLGLVGTVLANATRPRQQALLV